MGSVKEALREAIDFVRQLRRPPAEINLLELLAANPAVRVPPAGVGPFAPVRPAKGSGELASRLLLRDRR